uniref:Uncharacterized protein n=1 Tax=Vitis vinifera TaxID=29760 RepID=A5BBU7_VITVI|nr:hypothetical protein VITISV_039217 [Vitis vinifera]
MDEQLRAVDEQLRVVDVMNNSRIGALYTQKGRSWSTIPSCGCNEQHWAVIDSSLAAAVATAPFDSRFDPRQRRHLIRAQLVSQLIRVQLVLLD